MNSKYDKYSQEKIIKSIVDNTIDLKQLSEKWRDNKDVVLASINQNGWGLYLASDRLKDDRDVVLAAIKQSGFELTYANKKMRSDKGLVLEAIKQNGYALEFVSERLQNDRDVVLAAVGKINDSYYIIYNVGSELVNESIFLTKLLKKIDIDKKIIKSNKGVAIIKKLLKNEDYKNIFYNIYGDIKLDLKFVENNSNVFDVLMSKYEEKLMLSDLDNINKKDVPKQKRLKF